MSDATSVIPSEDAKQHVSSKPLHFEPPSPTAVEKLPLPGPLATENSPYVQTENERLTVSIGESNSGFINSHNRAKRKPSTTEQPKDKRPKTPKTSSMGAQEVILRRWYIKLLTGSRTPASVQVEGWKPKSSPTDKEEFHWHSSIIVTRESPTEVRTQSGTLYRLDGQMDTDCPEFKREEWSEEIIKKFKNGFPKNWQELLDIEVKKRPKNQFKKKKKRKPSYLEGENPSKRRKLTESSKSGIETEVSQADIDINSDVFQESLLTNKQSSETSPHLRFGEAPNVLLPSNPETNASLQNSLKTTTIEPALNTDESSTENQTKKQALQREKSTDINKEVRKSTSASVQKVSVINGEDSNTVTETAYAAGTYAPLVQSLRATALSKAENKAKFSVKNPCKHNCKNKLTCTHSCCHLSIDEFYVPEGSNVRKANAELKRVTQSNSHELLISKVKENELQEAKGKTIRTEERNKDLQENGKSGGDEIRVGTLKGRGKGREKESLIEPEKPHKDLGEFVNPEITQDNIDFTQIHKETTRDSEQLANTDLKTLTHENEKIDKYAHDLQRDELLQYIQVKGNNRAPLGLEGPILHIVFNCGSVDNSTLKKMIDFGKTEQENNFEEFSLCTHSCTNRYLCKHHCCKVGLLPKEPLRSSEIHKDLTVAQNSTKNHKKESQTPPVLAKKHGTDSKTIIAPTSLLEPTLADLDIDFDLNSDLDSQQDVTLSKEGTSSVQNTEVTREKLEHFLGLVSGLEAKRFSLMQRAENFKLNVSVITCKQNKLNQNFCAALTFEKKAWDVFQEIESRWAVLKSLVEEKERKEAQLKDSLMKKVDHLEKLLKRKTFMSNQIYERQGKLNSLQNQLHRGNDKLHEKYAQTKEKARNALQIYNEKVQALDCSTTQILAKAKQMEEIAKDKLLECKKLEAHSERQVQESSETEKKIKYGEIEVLTNHCNALMKLLDARNTFCKVLHSKVLTLILHQSQCENDLATTLENELASQNANEIAVGNLLVSKNKLYQKTRDLLEKQRFLATIKQKLAVLNLFIKKKNLELKRVTLQTSSQFLGKNLSSQGIDQHKTAFKSYFDSLVKHFDALVNLRKTTNHNYSLIFRRLEIVKNIWILRTNQAKGAKAVEILTIDLQAQIDTRYYATRKTTLLAVLNSREKLLAEKHAKRKTLLARERLGSITVENFQQKKMLWKKKIQLLKSKEEQALKMVAAHKINSVKINNAVITDKLASIIKRHDVARKQYEKLGECVKLQKLKLQQLKSISPSKPTQLKVIDLILPDDDELREGFLPPSTVSSPSASSSLSSTSQPLSNDTQVSPPHSQGKKRRRDSSLPTRSISYKSSSKDIGRNDNRSNGTSDTNLSRNESRGENRSDNKNSHRFDSRNDSRSDKNDRGSRSNSRSYSSRSDRDEFRNSGNDSSRSTAVRSDSRYDKGKNSPRGDRAGQRDKLQSKSKDEHATQSTTKSSSSHSSPSQPSTKRAPTKELSQGPQMLDEADRLPKKPKVLGSEQNTTETNFTSSTGSKTLSDVVVISAGVDSTAFNNDLDEFEDDDVSGELPYDH